jgi:hypothetical protein
VYQIELLREDRVAPSQGRRQLRSGGGQALWGRIWRPAFCTLTDGRIPPSSLDFFSHQETSVKRNKRSELSIGENCRDRRAWEINCPSRKARNASCQYPIMKQRRLPRDRHELYSHEQPLYLARATKRKGPFREPN